MAAKKEKKEKQLTREEELTRIVLKTKKTSYKDLPRMSRRISVIDNRENKNVTLLRKGMLLPIAQSLYSNSSMHNMDKEEEKQKSDIINDTDDSKNDNDTNSSSNSNSLQTESAASQSIWERISNILLTVAKLCVLVDASDPQNELVLSTLQKVLGRESVFKKTDQFEPELQHIFEDNGIAECTLMRVLNGCNQNVIFGAFYQLLKEYFIPNGFQGMKDVRGENGWNIEVYFNAKAVVRILHQRQTQYCQPHDETAKHFRVKWELDMSFAPRLEKCNSAFVRVCGIEFDENVDLEYKNEIKTKLTGGNLIFH